jgi:hypothetical protein
MRVLPILILSSLLLSFFFCAVSDVADAASKPIPKRAEEPEYPTLEIVVSLVIIGVAAITFELFRRRRLKR